MNPQRNQLMWRQTTRLAVLAGVPAVGVVAGFATALVGDRAGMRAVYFLAVFCLITVGFLIAVTRAEPRRFVFLALLASFPVAYALVPPGRFGITIFDTVILGLTVITLAANAMSPVKTRYTIFPSRSLLVAWILALPCVLFSEFPLTSINNVFLTFGIYMFMVFCLAELRTKNGIESLSVLLCLVAIIMSIGLLVDFVFQVNLSMRGSNVNQLTFLSGLKIYRAAGFFQDPQKAGTFLSCLITFLLVLAVRGRFSKRSVRVLVWFAVVVSLAVLPTTIARSAIVSCVLVSVLALFAFNGWSAQLKVFVASMFLLCVAIVAQTPLALWVDFLPATITERFQQLPEELQNRIDIWFDTWDMIAENPISGIGPGSFQEYLLRERPGIINYYGIGLAAGQPYVPDQPESGYFKILYEGGLLGASAVLIAVGDTIRRALGVIADPAIESDARTECVAALAGIASFSVTFVTVFTIGDRRVGALFALMMAVIWNRYLEQQQKRCTLENG